MAPKSDPALLDAFRKQCGAMGPGLAFLAWQGQAGVDPDDLLDIVKEFERQAAPACDPTRPNGVSPVPHVYEVVGEDYGSLGSGGDYEVLECQVCGRRSYSVLPD